MNLARRQYVDSRSCSARYHQLATTILPHRLTSFLIQSFSAHSSCSYSSFPFLFRSGSLYEVDRRGGLLVFLAVTFNLPRCAFNQCPEANWENCIESYQEDEQSMPYCTKRNEGPRLKGVNPSQSNRFSQVKYHPYVEFEWTSSGLAPLTRIMYCTWWIRQTQLV